MLLMGTSSPKSGELTPDATSSLAASSLLPSSSTTNPQLSLQQSQDIITFTFCTLYQFFFT